MLVSAEIPNYSFFIEEPLLIVSVVVNLISSFGNGISMSLSVFTKNRKLMSKCTVLGVVKILEHKF